MDWPCLRVFSLHRKLAFEIKLMIQAALRRDTFPNYDPISQFSGELNRLD
jgi:hypothetical protein